MGSQKLQPGAMLLSYMECSEIQVATSSLTDYHLHSQYGLNQTVLNCLTNSTTHQVIVLESCSSPQKNWQVFESAMKKFFFGFEFGIFCEWCDKLSSFRPFWPTSSGPRLDGSISLNFLLETKLKSESFKALD